MSDLTDKLQEVANRLEDENWHTEAEKVTEALAMAKITERRLAETEKAGEDIRKKNEGLIFENKKLLEANKEYELSNEQLNKTIEHFEAKVDKELKAGLDIIKADLNLPRADKTVIARDGRDWKTFTETYQELLDLCCKHGMVVVVLP